MGQIMLFYTIVLGALFAICVQARVLTSDVAKPTGMLEQSLIGKNPGLRFQSISNHTEDGSLIVLDVSFAIRVQARVLTSDEAKPTEVLEQSLNGTTPGLRFQPISNGSEYDSLIWYNARNATSVRKWTELLDEYLEVYRDSSKLEGGGRNRGGCSFDYKPGPGQVCAVEVNSWGPCTQGNGYGYANSQPCVFLELDQIYGWVADYYNDTDDLPADMPLHLKEYIVDRSRHRYSLDAIWVSCEGESPADVQNIGPIEYYPARGFPGYFYPYMNLEGYLSPLIAVRFARLRTGILINVECKAWAKNIIHSRADRLGSVHFELMVD